MEVSFLKGVLLAAINKSIYHLNKCRSKLEKKETQKLPYSSLAPIDDADKDGHYFDALCWALKNRKEKDIKNIAITGGYGSGKSSVLKTFQKRYTDKDLCFLNISLATFKEEKPTSTTKGTESSTSNDILRLIELSILQQIFYKEDASDIPGSRFKKIQSFSKNNLRWLTALSLLWLAGFICFFYFDIIKNLFVPSCHPTNAELVRYVSVFIIGIGLFVFSLIVVYRIIKSLKSIKIKIKIKDTEIEINEDIDKSILNHHLDEILYFFEVTKYNVVIFEDLDRFQQTEIFTKLREINLLLNNSKSICKKKDDGIVFIYAVRDDIFKEDKERAKFFDFILPIIPFLNSTNSNSILLKKKEENGFNISESLIDDISSFIDDSRLLSNIINEFYIYSKKQNNDLSHDKLLAIITYKNIFSEDFALLNNNDGELFSVFKSKRSFIKQSIEQKKKEIDVIKDEIKKLENIFVSDIKELRIIYVATILKEHIRNYFESFRLDNVAITSIDDMLTDDRFNLLIKKGTNCHVRNHSGYTYPVNFSSIEKNVNCTYTYLERHKQVEDRNNGKIEQLKQELTKLEKEITTIRHYTIRELLLDNYITPNKENEKQRNLILLLLRNGYITEDYSDYTSIFHEGSLTKADNAFLIQIKNGIAIEPDFKLQKVDNLISKIDSIYFKKPNVLNYDLVDRLLLNENDTEKIDFLYNQLVDESDSSIKFINEYIDNGIEIEKFIKLLCKKWTAIWHYISNRSIYTQDLIQTYFKLILEHADCLDIKQISDCSSFKQHILSKTDFLTTIENIEKLKEIIEVLELKFINIDEAKFPSGLHRFIYDNNRYEINATMLIVMLKTNNQYNYEDFYTKNYYSITKSTCDTLVEYINDNILAYIDSVYLKLEPNDKEDEQALISLLNNEIILPEQKEKIIRRSSTIITNLSQINDTDINAVLFKSNKVTATWDNVFNHYKNTNNTIDESLIIFINTEGVAFQLSQAKIQKDSSKDVRTYQDFIIQIMTTENFVESAYNQILKSVPYKWTYDFGYTRLSETKVEWLISLGTISLSKDNYKSLKESFNDLHIKFIVKQKDAFRKIIAESKISDYPFENADILLVLKDNSLPPDIKRDILASVDESTIINNDQIISKIASLVDQYDDFKTSLNVLKAIISHDTIDDGIKIRIFNTNENEFDNDDVATFLKKLTPPLSDIASNGKRPLIQNANQEIQKLIDILKSRNYISTYVTDEKGIRVYTIKNKDTENEE